MINKIINSQYIVLFFLLSFILSYAFIGWGLYIIKDYTTLLLMNISYDILLFYVLYKYTYTNNFKKAYFRHKIGCYIGFFWLIIRIILHISYVVNEFR